MALDQIMEEHGFKVSSSCSGFEWFIKRIQYQGNEAFVTVTAEDELHLPDSAEEPVLVSISDVDSGKELEAPRRFESLKSYLDTLEPPV